MIVVGGFPGRNVVGLNGRFGVRPAAFAAAGEFENPFLNDVDAGDETREFLGVVTSLPGSGTVVFDDDGGFEHTGAADGSYATVFNLFTWAQGGPVTAHGAETITTTFGSTSTASGATLTAAASLIAGTASGAVGASAAGVQLSAAAGLLPGTATGQRAATAAGATLVAAAGLLAGGAAGEGAGTAPGVLLAAAASLLAGAASGQASATAAGVTLTAAASLVRDTASGSGTGGSIDPAIVWGYVLADGRTAEQTLLDNNRMLRIVMAALSGQTAGVGTATETYFGEDGVTPRLVATFDGQGNRVTVVTNGAP